MTLLKLRTMNSVHGSALSVSFLKHWKLTESSVLSHSVLLLWDLFFATPKEFEDVALFLPLGLLSTLTRQEKNNFAKTLFKPEGFENVGFLMTSR